MEMVEYICNYLETLNERRVTPSVEPGYLRHLLPSKPVATQAALPRSPLTTFVFSLSPSRSRGAAGARGLGPDHGRRRGQNHARGDPLATPPFPCLLPGGQLLSLHPGRHAGRRHRLHWFLLGGESRLHRTGDDRPRLAGEGHRAAGPLSGPERGQHWRRGHPGNSPFPDSPSSNLQKANM